MTASQFQTFLLQMPLLCWHRVTRRLRPLRAQTAGTEPRCVYLLWPPGWPRGASTLTPATGPRTSATLGEVKAGTWGLCPRGAGQLYSQGLRSGPGESSAGITRGRRESVLPGRIIPHLGKLWNTAGQVQVTCSLMEQRGPFRHTRSLAWLPLR